MLEMAKYLYDEEAAFYRDLAEKFIGSVYRNYAVKDFEKSKRDRTAQHIFEPFAV